MSEQDRFVPGVPNWVELTTPDLQAAQTFYGGLFGWTFSNAGPAPGGGPYLLAELSGGAVGALVQGEPGGWNSYVLVDDVDDTAERVRAAGGGSSGSPPMWTKAVSWPSPTRRAPSSASGSRAADVGPTSSTLTAR